MLKKILVANRGEIAIRIMRTCSELGIETVAVYSEADKQSLHAKYADESYCIGGPPPAESYLNISKIIEVAKNSGADGLHPGYGFLAENTGFAYACQREGITFIGPSPNTIMSMGDKIQARKMMRAADIPVVPGSDEIENIDDARKIAKELGYPVMVKSAAGGGGIGIKIARDENEIDESINLTKKLSSSVFGDDKIYIEKYLEKPRHIEFQILSDSFGNIIHIGERECSIQRRHQKLIEECPSPIMTEELRETMGKLSVKIASVAEYSNAGTVEYIYSNEQFYFMELNTRLQVEHAVTEMTTGVDIVKEQIRIASGYPLSIKQEDVELRGWSIECRINAEDPLNNFAPSYGILRGYCSPGGIGVRVDGGVYPYWEIPPQYDSMVSKLIVWGRDRKEAIERMNRALAEFVIAGVKTNIPLHRAIMENPDFISGNITTHFISEEKNLMENVRKIADEYELLQAGAATAFGASQEIQHADTTKALSPPLRIVQEELHGTEAKVESEDSENPVVAPMQATVAFLKAKTGDKVKKGDVLVILEAMKVLSPVDAPCDGVIKTVCIKESDIVSAGDTLIVIK
ncbi:MAG: acetyl-CoA carboxylase biotin carboxylase subunit [Planctomycetota bacterium]